ncbi:60 kDa inner membrane protein [Aster yellows witches'-broom phytoplasma AYWB]|uniref:60 kDa inner membrane protein n=2 Tax=16SrI (Aster yellows group) TaxID=3042590 RepID=Q2NJ04_AYWBP|nr:membrane protein insertase YidC [Aster yellows witches'-broom phytoplasma]ABC65589.1 60 kDa inner membrane protein [Aster yellows witches'-broom phytoplasma AYWB]
MDVRNHSSKNFFLFLTIFLFGLFFWLLTPPKPEKIEVLDKVVVFKNSEKHKKYFDPVDSSKLLSDYADIFVVYVINDKKKEIQISTQDEFKGMLAKKKEAKYFFSLIKKPDPKLKDEFNFSKLDNKEEYFLTFKTDKETTEFKNKLMKDFLTVAAGTNDDYIENNKYQKKELRDALEFQKIDSSNKLISVSLENIKLEDDYAENIKNTSNNVLSKINVRFNNGRLMPRKLFITNFSVPIQFTSRLEWSLFGYFWNILIISIGSFLYFFSTFLVYGASGMFFGNLGLGIVLATVFIRTLTWPIYTKTSTLSMNMSLIQSEIEKVKQKYAIKKDLASAQKMQLEILKVYRKNNFSFWGFLLSFLQLPLFIAINQTLSRFIIPGGIFATDKLIEKPFLGLINLKPSNPNNAFVIFLLSFLVGATMFILNKISFKKPDYLKTPSYHLTSEQKQKAKQSEKSIKIMSVFMILMMVFFSRSNPILSLYWIVGNTYTIFQTLLTRKKIQKKYFALKQNNL